MYINIYELKFFWVWFYGLVIRFYCEIKDKIVFGLRGNIIVIIFIEYYDNIKRYLIFFNVLF